MQVLGLDMAHIAECGTPSAQAGAIRAGEVMGDEVFDHVTGTAILICEKLPPST